MERMVDKRKDFGLIFLDNDRTEERILLTNGSLFSILERRGVEKGNVCVKILCGPPNVTFCYNESESESFSNSFYTWIKSRVPAGTFIQFRKYKNRIDVESFMDENYDDADGLISISPGGHLTYTHF